MALPLRQVLTKRIPTKILHTLGTVGLMVVVASSPGDRLDPTASLLALESRRLPSTSVRQQQSTLTTPMSTLEVTIDGRANPSLISDDLAARHLMASLAVPTESDSTELAGRDAALEQIGLEEQDQRSGLLALQGVGNQLEALHNQRQAFDALPRAEQSGGTFELLQLQEHSVLRDAYGRFRDSLSAPGKARLDWFLQNYVKRHIVVYGGPMMTTP